MRSSAARSPAATACSRCSCHGACSGYSTGTAQAVLDHAEPGARLVFSCGWHISRDGEDRYSRLFKLKVALFSLAGRLEARQLRRPRRPGRGEPPHLRQRHALDGRARQRPRGGRERGAARCGAGHIGDPVLASNRTRRIDFALFMVDALDPRRAHPRGARHRRLPERRRRKRTAQGRRRRPPSTERRRHELSPAGRGPSSARGIGATVTGRGKQQRTGDQRVSGVAWIVVVVKSAAGGCRAPSTSDATRRTCVRTG